MEEKKNIKINLSTFFLIISLIIIVIMGVFIYKLYKDNKNAETKFQNLRSQLEQMEKDLIILKATSDNKFTDLDNYEFKLDTQNKYIITTDYKWITMQNDGGSNTDIYYQIDLDNNIICKIVENYVANIGGTPEKSKTIDYTKKIDDSIQLELKTLLNEVLTKQDTNENKNYSFYTIEVLNNETKIYNENTIKSIKTLLNKVDEL